MKHGEISIFVPPYPSGDTAWRRGHGWWPPHISVPRPGPSHLCPPQASCPDLRQHCHDIITTHRTRWKYIRAFSSSLMAKSAWKSYNEEFRLVSYLALQDYCFRASGVSRTGISFTDRIKCILGSFPERVSEGESVLQSPGLVSQPEPDLAPEEEAVGVGSTDGLLITTTLSRQNIVQGGEGQCPGLPLHVELDQVWEVEAGVGHILLWLSPAVPPPENFSASLELERWYREDCGWCVLDGVFQYLSQDWMFSCN